MSMLASQITSHTIVYLSVYSDAYQRKHQSSASLVFVRGIRRSPVNAPHKGPVTRKYFHLMTSSWDYITSSVYHIVSWGPFYWHVLISIPVWKSNHIHYEVLDEITYPLLNFNAVILEFWEWISNFTPHLTGPMISSNKLADHTADRTNPGKWGACFSGNCPADTLRNNDVVITSKWRHFDVITSKWRRFDVITTLLLRHVFSGWVATSMCTY